MGVARERVVVAMSGGVDSSVAAAMLAREGYDVVGVTLRLRTCEGRVASVSGCATDGCALGRDVARVLRIPHCVLDCREEFTNRVLRPSWNEYARGRTPSPCLLCNRDIKFGALRNHAARIGARFVATGHYARVVDDGHGPTLKRAYDRRKDQSYFLSALDPDLLRDILFPIGTLTKAAVRTMARDLGLPAADSGESQDACMVSPGIGLAETLRREFGAPARPGSLVSPRGEVLGRHEGIHRFTIGQRRGLGLALGARAFVSAIHAEDASVVVSTDERDLEAGGLVARGVRWLCVSSGPCQAQIRSRHEAASGRLEVGDQGTVRFLFDRPQRSVTPGQAVAFFDGERVLGGGWIDCSVRNGAASRGTLEESAHGDNL